MGTCIRERLSYANVMATLAVVIALGGSAYAAVQIPPNSVGTSKLRDGAVTGKKLADHAVTQSKVANASLTGRAFSCQSGDVGLGNRNLCAFKIKAPNLVNWSEAIQMCRARGSTPATLPTPAELMAFAPLGGSPFKGPAEFWTSDLSSGATDNRAWAIQTDANGDVAVISSTPLTMQVTDTIACVYHAADVF